MLYSLLKISPLFGGQSMACLYPTMHRHTTALDDRPMSAAGATIALSRELYVSPSKPSFHDLCQPSSPLLLRHSLVLFLWDEFTAASSKGRDKVDNDVD